MNETPLTLIGNLTDQPELRYTARGAAMAKFTVASTPRVFNRTTNEYRDGDTLFLACTAWRDLAEHIADSLTKGTRVVVTGRLRLSRWETDEGEKRSAYGLDVDEVGPSLRYATAKVQKTTRRSTGDGFLPDVLPDEVWATAVPAEQHRRTQPSPDPSGLIGPTAPSGPSGSAATDRLAVLAPDDPGQHAAPAGPVRPTLVPSADRVA